MRPGLFVVTMVILSLAEGGARSDEALVPTAESGSWVAMEHRESMAAPPDICLALHVPSGVAFRSDGTTVEIRVLNKTWSLPSSVKGTLVISVEEWKQSFPIVENTSDMVNAEIPEEAASALFLKMDHASSMRVLAGKAKPIDVSLTGSTRVTNAFRTCAGIEGNAASTGSNPFQ